MTENEQAAWIAETEKRMRDHAVKAVLETLDWYAPAALEGVADGVGKLRDEGRMFSIRHEGVDLYPAFAFSSAAFPKPLPVIKEVIDLYVEKRGKLGGWTLAFWFASVNGYLGGKRPADIAETNPYILMAAWRNELVGIQHG